MIFNSRYLFLKGFLSATLLLFALFFVLKPKSRYSDNPYVVLKTDYKIGGAGLINKGTILRVDEGMSEGFTRFILYLNLKGGEYEKHSDNYTGIIPYWLHEIPSTDSLR